MFENTSKPTFEAIEGERGLPIVNSNPKNSIKRFIRIFLLSVILLTFVFVYWIFPSHIQKEINPTTSNAQINSTVPNKEFKNLPDQNNINQNHEAINNSTNLPNRQQFESVDDSTVDKSSSELMITKESVSSESTITKNAAAPEPKGGIESLLNPTVTPMRYASVLPDRNYVLAKGSFIDCVLQTRLDTTVPGMSSCVVSRNIYSDSGKVLLVERGSTLSGEYQSNMHQGQNRIFVLWNRVKTPNGVIINLDSPGTDSLGGSGLPGYVDNHFFQRFGGAVLMSLVQDFSEAAASQIDRSNTTINLNNTSDTTSNIAIETLKNTINIPPTLYKNQGDRIGVFVARDLDFKTVYALKAR